jgi:hypothetical protein
MATSTPPRHLRAATKRWFADVCAGYEHVKLLTAAAESWDRLQEAREAIAKFGLTFNDRFGNPRARPEVGIERDAKIAFARLVRELRLDVGPPDDATRPPRLPETNGHRKRGV